MKLENNNPSISTGGLEPETNDHDVSSLDRDSGSDTGGAKEIVYLKGIRFVMLASLIGIMVFTVSVEANVAVTSLISITDDLGDFDRVSWIISSYQLGFVDQTEAMIVISAKLSDLFGRKPITAIFLFIFTVFSGGCAAAQTMTQLIVVRAFQGLGGGACYTLAAILIIDSAPSEKYGKYVANAGIAIAMGTVLGPIIGGAITESTTWRWIFLFNVPVGALALGLLLLGMPSSFPYRKHDHDHRSLKAVFNSFSKTVDLPGSALTLGAVLSFVACFMEADSRFPWKSAYVIVLLITSVALSVALLLWERHVTKLDKARQPVLPWRLFTNRVMGGIMIVMLSVGGPMAVTTFQIPQRFQLVNGLSSLDAGVRLLPFGAMFPVGCMAGTTIASRFRVPSIYLILIGVVMQIIGYALLSTLGTSDQIEASVYGYLILCGFGCGMSFTMAYLTVPFTVEPGDKAVGMAAANQFRTMGSAMALAIATSIFNGFVLSRFSELGINEPLSTLLADRQSLPSDVQEDTRQILSEAYNRQMIVLCALAAAQIPAALLMSKRKQIVTA